MTTTIASIKSNLYALKLRAAQWHEGGRKCAQQCTYVHMYIDL